jgi:hypothetical protein
MRNLKALDDSSSSSDGIDYNDDQNPTEPLSVLDALRNFQPPELLNNQDEEKKTQ